MSEAVEVSPDDPAGVAAAIERAAQGSPVHLVRDGRAVADIVPPRDASTPGSGRTAVARDRRHDQIVRAHADRHGAPTLEHYRRTWATTGRTWPGDDYIRAHYPVADTS